MKNGQVKRISFIRIDSIGRKTNIKEREIKQYLDKDGYCRVMLTTGLEKTKFIPVHRLVAKAFIPNPNNYPCINHKDEEKTNNNVENLEWCNVKYNNSYGTRMKRISITQGTKIIGIKDENIIRFNSIREAARFLNNEYAYTNIIKYLKKEGNSAYGYKWEYASEVI